MKLSGGLIFCKNEIKKKTRKNKNWKNHDKAEQKKTSKNIGKEIAGKAGNGKMADFEWRNKWGNVEIN